MIQTLENRVKMAMRGTRPGATLTAEDIDALYGFIEAEIVDAMKEAKKEGTNAEREACAMICEGHAKDHRSAPEDSPVQYAASEAETLAAAIRARSES